MKTESIYEDYNKNQSEEAYNLLKKRLKANNLNLSLIRNKDILNICDPSGRYTSALYKLGEKVQTFNETAKPINWNSNFQYKKINLSKNLIVMKFLILFFVMVS